MGVDPAGIEANVEVLKPLLRLDPRGGYFNHDDISSAISAIVTQKHLVNKVRVLARTAGMPLETLAELWAVRVRVMLAHTRKRAKNVAETNLVARALGTLITAKQGGKAAGPGAKVKNPFIFVGAEGADGDDCREDDDEDGELLDEVPYPIFVKKLERDMTCVLTNGRTITASSYTQEEGFVVAHWEKIINNDNEPFQFVTDLTADWLAEDGRLTEPKRVAPTPKGKGKAKAKAKGKAKAKAKGKAKAKAKGKAKAKAKAKVAPGTWNPDNEDAESEEEENGEAEAEVDEAATPEKPPKKLKKEARGRRG